MIVYRHNLLSRLLRIVLVASKFKPYAVIEFKLLAVVIVDLNFSLIWLCFIVIYKILYILVGKNVYNYFEILKKKKLKSMIF